MQMAITFLTVTVGLVFSLAVALVAEELIFGQVIRVFFVRQAIEAKAAQKR
jgi:HAMP domain-containing protein